MDVIGILKKLGYTTVDSSFYNHISLWRDWYKGKADFHKYKYYNGLKFIERERKSLGMAKKVAEDKADLLLNEKVSINLENEAFQEVLDTILEDNNFWVEGNQLIELSHALGTGAFVEYLDGEEVKIDFVEADCIFPLTWDNGSITECAFVSEFHDTEKRFYLNIHTLENGRYIVQNMIFDEDGKMIPLPEDVVPIWGTGSYTPLFQIIKPNIVNSIDTKIPLGMSIYGNAIDVLEGVDMIYDSYINEFTLGKKRIFVDDTVTKINMENGRIQPLFDPNDTTFYGIPMNSSDGKNKPIEESDLSLRVQEHELGLQRQLNILSSKCGFGQNYYQFDRSGVKTATEVISENSQLYRTIKKDEIILNKALTDMVKAILFLNGINPEVEINIAFDDSIVEDTNAIAQRALLEYQSGLIDKVEYYKRVYKYTEEQAVKLSNDIEKRAPESQDMSFFSGGFSGGEE